MYQEDAGGTRSLTGLDRDQRVACTATLCVPETVERQTPTGWMFWFIRNRFVGSYFAFSAARRA